MYHHRMPRFVAFVLGLYFSAVAMLLLAGRVLPEADGTALSQFCLAAAVVFWPAHVIWVIEKKSPPRPPATTRDKTRALGGGAIAGAVCAALAWLVKASMSLGNRAFEGRAWPAAAILLIGVTVLVVPGVVWVWMFPAESPLDK
jgi:hypothetical protein